MRAAPLLLLSLLAGLAAGPAGAETGAVAGRLEIALPGTQLSQLGPVVVYLEPLDGDAEFSVSARPVTLWQRNARFSPAFLAIVRGQTVEMPNADAIYHNVFSYSRPNDFDLGTYPAGESRSVRFDYAGIVKTYCAIHETMNATIFVSPTPWYAVLSKSGRFEIEGVPPGRYALHVWCEKLPPRQQPIELAAGDRLELAIPLTLASP